MRYEVCGNMYEEMPEYGIDRVLVKIAELCIENNWTRQNGTPSRPGHFYTDDEKTLIRESWGDQLPGSTRIGGYSYTDRHGGFIRIHTWESDGTHCNPKWGFEVEDDTIIIYYC
jgi:hypothetical protein